jgi:formyl-CoA transferase
MYATTAILAALVHRDRTGEGQYIDLALFDTQIAVMANVANAYLCTEKIPQRQGNTSPIVVPYQTFPVADGWIIVVAGNDSQFRQFVTAGGQAALAEDPRFVTNPLRVQNRQVLIPLLEVMTRQKTKAEWISALEKVGVPCGPINDLKEVFNDAQVQSRGMEIHIHHPTTGSMKLVASPMHLSKTPVELNLPPPTLGQHTKEILAQHLHLDANAIAQLHKKGII